MELTRRDALGALVAAGAVGAGIAVSETDIGGEDPEPSTAETLAAAAEVLFPSEVEGHREFVGTFVRGRITGREAYRDGLSAAVDTLEEVARSWEGDRFGALSLERRESLLYQLGVDTAEPDAEGTDAERIRRFVVDELLFAFYASPAGGRLVGIENPTGYPGGIESYQRASVPEEGDG